MPIIIKKRVQRSYPRPDMPSMSFPRLPKIPLKAFFIALLVLFGAGVIYYGATNVQSISLPKLPQILGAKTTPTGSPSQEKVNQLVDIVRHKAKLPKDETPNVATVSDASKLQDQAFFAKAKNGDKVLIYVAYQKAFLYRPSTDEIIQESPLEIIEGKDQTASPSAATDPKHPPLRIKL